MSLSAVSGTGSITFGSVSGSIPSAPGGILTYGYFSGDIVLTNSSYVSGTSDNPSQGILNFGQNLSELNLINNSESYIAFQWKEFWGQNVDNGVLPPGATITVRRSYKGGMKLRCADASGTANALVWGI